MYLDAFLPANGQSLFDLGGPPRTDDWRVPPLQRTENSADPEVQWQAAQRVRD